MDWGITLGIVSLLFTIWGIYLTIKYPSQGRLAFVQESCIGLFDSTVKTLPDLEIFYKKKPINENLVLLKGAIFNMGREDISQAMVDDKIFYSPSKKLSLGRSKNYLRPL